MGFDFFLSVCGFHLIGLDTPLHLKVKYHNGSCKPGVIAIAADLRRAHRIYETIMKNPLVPLSLLRKRERRPVERSM